MRRPITLRPPTRDFRDFVAGLPEYDVSLPLTHVTDAYDLRKIVRDGHIQPRDCPIFKTPLVYLFSGRPAYRKNSDELPNSLKAYSPIAFILDPAVGTPCRHIYPFDTGAFQAKLYNDVLHTSMRVEDFELEADPKTPGRLIAFFFGTAEQYFDRDPNRSLNIPPGEFEVASYYELILFRGKNRRDDRSSAIEIAVNNPIALDYKVLAVIIPYSLVDDEKTGRPLSDRKIHLIPYKDGDGFIPAEQIPRLYDLARDFYTRGKYL